MMMNNNFFQSSDLSLVSALLSIGYNIDSVDKTNGQRAVFLVARDEFLDNKVQAFWSHALMVDPLTYFNCLKEAKTRLYS